VSFDGLGEVCVHAPPGAGKGRKTTMKEDRNRPNIHLMPPSSPPTPLPHCLPPTPLQDCKG
jgi:hypothetical protein